MTTDTSWNQGVRLGAQRNLPCEDSQEGTRLLVGLARLHLCRLLRPNRPKS